METRADEFVTQAREHLAVLEEVLLSLEKPGESADDRERIDRCLRLVHSLKGDAGFLGYTAIRTLANAMETVLEAMRNEVVAARPPPVERLLVARDRLSTLVDDLQSSQGVDLREILAQLERVERSPIRSPPAMGRRPASGGSSASRAPRRILLRIRALRPRDRARHQPVVDRPESRTSRGADSLPSRLSSSRPAEEIRLDLGLPMSAIGRPGRARLAAIDRPGGVGASRRRPLGALLADLDRLGHLEDPDLEFGMCDLATSLPVGPILLRGRLRTGLAREDVDRRLQLPVPGSSIRPPTAAIASPATPPPPRAPQPESAPAAKEGPVAAARASARNTTRRPRCGSTSSCSTG